VTGTVDIASEYQLVIGPSGDVLSTEDIKQHLGFLGDDADIVSQINDFQTMAVERIESETRRQLLTATYKVFFSCFRNPLRIRKPPVQSISSVKYLDNNEDTQTVATSVYESFLDREPGEIWLQDGESWPVSLPHQRAVTVEFVTGYGDWTDIPSTVRHLIRLIVEQNYFGHDKHEPTIQRLMSQMSWGY